MKKYFLFFFFALIITFNFSYAQENAVRQTLIQQILSGISTAKNNILNGVESLKEKAGEVLFDRNEVDTSSDPDKYSIRNNNYKHGEAIKPEDLAQVLQEVDAEKERIQKELEGEKEVETGSIEKKPEEKQGGGSGSGGAPGGQGDGKEQGGEKGGNEKGGGDGKLEAGRAGKTQRCKALAEAKDKIVTPGTFGKYSYVELSPLGEAKVTSVLQGPLANQKLKTNDYYTANEDFIPIAKNKQTCCTKIQNKNGLFICAEIGGQSEIESKLGNTGKKETE